MNKRYKSALLIAGGVIILLAACWNDQPQTSASRVMDDYKSQLRILSAQTGQLVRLVQQGAALPQLKQQFVKTRTAYKKVEWLAEYYFPYTAKKINGPALAEVEADEKNIVIEPEGFQVIEEQLYGDAGSSNAAWLLQQTKILQADANRLQYLASMQETTDAHIFDALRLEVFRILTLGITGFDSPVAANSLDEAATALTNIRHTLAFYNKPGKSTHPEGILKQSVQYINAANDFNSFNRMEFITRFLNPLSESLLAFQHDLGIPVFTEPRALAAGAATLFEQGIFQPDFYAPGTQAYSKPEKVALGKKLFYDGILSGDGKRSCATCHEPARAFTDGFATSFSVNGKTTIRRNAPTLINAALQPALFYDMRVNYLEDQAKDVISNKDEMHGSLETTVEHLNKQPVYQQLFRQVFGEKEVSELQVKNALAAYVRSLVRMNARFDRYMNGHKEAMSRLEIDGFNLFAGKAKCATCHFIPLFNGVNPPQFSKTDAEVIGVPANADTLHPVADPDEGKYNLYGIELHKKAFKTPTVRNIELTAPYMHNGVFKTLEEVVEFYNRGGGAGLGLDSPNQTLPADKLNLTAYEKISLVAFMKTLTDTSRVKQ